MFGRKLAFIRSTFFRAFPDRDILELALLFVQQLLAPRAEYSRFLLLFHRLDLEEIFERLFLDAVYHIHEHGIGLVLIFYQRIALAIRPQPYPLP